MRGKSLYKSMVYTLVTFTLVTVIADHKQHWQSDRRIYKVCKELASCNEVLYAAGCKLIHNGVVNGILVLSHQECT